MADAPFSAVLRECGFTAIGYLSYRLHIEVWWHPGAKVSVLLLGLDQGMLLRAGKSYFLRSITEEGETWARDMGPLQDYLEAHFPEVQVSFSHFRDVPKALAALHARRKLALDAPNRIIPTVEDLSRLQRQARGHRSQAAGLQHMASMLSEPEDVLTGHLRRQERDHLRRADEGARQLERGREQRALLDDLQQEYLEKGRAATYTFTINTPPVVVTHVSEFRDALAMAIKDLGDQHRYQVTQKLLGGKLRIQVAESGEPILTWIEQWFGGALPPHQLERLSPALQGLKSHLNSETMVVPASDVQVDGHVREDGKRIAAHVVAHVARRLDQTGRRTETLDNLRPEDKPISLGREIKGDGLARKALDLPLAKLANVYISGSTGAGKSYAGRVLIEEAARYDDLHILVLDPRNQAAGILVPEDRDTILEQYGDWGMPPDDARGSAFRQVAPGMAAGESLPNNLAMLGTDRCVVSFKGMDDGDRCTLFADILEAVFTDYSQEESASVRLLIVVEEAQRFTKKHVDDTAKGAGVRAERVLDMLVREVRKYGGCVAILSQTIRDFAYDSASIRQNTNTKVFLHNSDREVAYAADFLDDGRAIVRLQPGTAIVFNAAWGARTIRVRPPFSKVWEYSPADTRQLVAGPIGEAAPLLLDEDARNLLRAVVDHVGETGQGPNLSEAAARAGISSRRALQQCVSDLERAGQVRSRKLQTRGRPRVLELIESREPDEERTKSGQNADPVDETVATDEISAWR